MAKIAFITKLLVIIFMVFLVSKIGGIEPVDSWSWWWVTSPLLVPVALYVITYLAMYIIYFYNRSKY